MHTGPLEAQAASLSKEIEGRQAESVQLQRAWVSRQAELVGLQVRACARVCVGGGGVG